MDYLTVEVLVKVVVTSESTAMQQVSRVYMLSSPDLRRCAETEHRIRPELVFNNIPPNATYDVVERWGTLDDEESNGKRCIRRRRTITYYTL